MNQNREARLEVGEGVEMVRWLFLVLTLFTVACVPLPAPPTPAQPTATVATVHSKKASKAVRAVRLAQEALAKRIGIPMEQVEVVAWSEDTFALDNLGCPSGSEPERGRPAMVVGYEVTLRVDGDEYVYHVYGRRVVFCRGPK